MAIALVQSATGATSGASTMGITLGSAPGAGHFLVVSTAGVNTFCSGVSSASGNWTQSSGSTRIWFLPNCAITDQTVTLTLANSSYDLEAVVAEFSGVATSSPQDGSSVVNSGTQAQNQSTGSLTTANANDVLITAFFSDENDTVFSTPTSGFGIVNQVNNISSGATAMSYLVVSNLGTFSTGVTQTGGNWKNTIAAFKASGAATYNDSVSFALHPTFSDSVVGSMQASIAFALHPVFSPSLPSTSTIIWQCDGGTITQTGLWTAPTTPGTYHITAIWTTNPQLTKTATVVVPPIVVGVTPSNVNMAAASTRLFTATVTGAASTSVTWLASTGVITAGGLYTADSPATTQQATITAASVTNPAIVGTALAVVSPVATTGPVPPPPPQYTLPLVWLTPFQHLTAVSNFTVTPSSAVLSGDFLTLILVPDTTAAQITAVSGGTANAWVVPFSFGRVAYGLNASGGTQQVTVTLNQAVTCSGFLAEWAGEVTAEPVQDGFVTNPWTGNVAATPQATPTPTVTDLAIALVEVIGTSHAVISNPANAFILPPISGTTQGVQVTTGQSTVCAIAYRVMTAAINASVTVQ